METPLLGTGIEANPGPDEDYQVDPALVPRIIQGLGCPTPRVDAFASGHNALWPLWWSFSDSAFSHCWQGDAPIWANPPFSMLAKVETHIATLGAHMVLICPEWGAIFRRLLAQAKASFRLPAGPVFRAVGGRLLPPPKWKVTALWIDVKVPAPPVDRCNCRRARVPLPGMVIDRVRRVQDP